MRTSTRLATTAGVTVLGLTAMSGFAQADTGGLVGGLTGTLSNTVGGVVKTATGASSTKSSSKSGKPVLNLPVHVHAGVPSGSGGGGGGKSRQAKSRGEVASANADASVKASVSPLAANANGVRERAHSAGPTDPSAAHPAHPGPADRAAGTALRGLAVVVRLGDGGRGQPSLHGRPDRNPRAPRCGRGADRGGRCHGIPPEAPARLLTARDS